MMLSTPAPPILLRQYLLMAIRDGFDRMTLRPGPYEFWYDMVGRLEGQEYDMVGPPTRSRARVPGCTWRR